MATGARVVAALWAIGVLLGVAQVRAQTPTVMRNEGNVRLEADDVERPSCGGCSIAVRVHIHSYRVRVRAPAEWQVEGVDAPQGGLSDLTISPDGMRAQAHVRAAGQGARNVPVVATFVHTGTAARATITHAYDDYDSREVIRCEPSPCSDPTFPPSGVGAVSSADDGRAPGIVIGRELVLDEVRFGAEWPARFGAVVMTRRGAPLVGGEASVVCSTGTASVTTNPASPPTFTFSSRAAVPRMVAGVHTCTLRVVRAAGARPLTGVLRFRIDSAGGLAIVSARLRVPPPPRPDPHRLTPTSL